MPQTIDPNIYKMSRRKTETSNVRVKRTPFGDGYDQVVLDGINTDEDSWEQYFIPMSNIESIALRNALKASVAGTANVISWTPDGDTGPKYWRASNIKRSHGPGITRVVSCTYTRTYIIS